MMNDVELEGLRGSDEYEAQKHAEEDVHAVRSKYRKYLIATGLLAVILAIVLAITAGIKSGGSNDGNVTNGDGNGSGSGTGESGSGTGNGNGNGNPPPSVSPAPPTGRDPIDIEVVMNHLKELEGIAHTHNGSRHVVTGYNASFDYVWKTLAATNYYNLSVHPFTMLSFKQEEPPVFKELSPDAATFAEGDDFAFLSYEGSGNITAAIVPVPNYGCNASDFDGITLTSKIALIKRGGKDCGFHDKAQNAVSRGAVGVVIYNEGNAPGRMKVFRGTLGELVAAPVFGVSFARGNGWAKQVAAGTEVVLNMYSKTSVSLAYTKNLIARTKQGDANSTVVVGAHLDGVEAGPGINDNGSGSMSILAIAQKLAQQKLLPVNRLQFSFWGAEEEGLIGSTKWVASQKAASTLHEVALNLNYDMEGSPNGERGVYNGAEHDAGSAVIMKMVEDDMKANNLEYELVSFNGRSDYGPFIAEDIPAGGLDTGAEVIKTMEGRKKFGGLAGAAFDPCYHAACDTVENINQNLLRDMSNAAYRTVVKLATTTNLRAVLKGEKKLN